MLIEESDHVKLPSGRTRLCEVIVLGSFLKALKMERSTPITKRMESLEGKSNLKLSEKKGKKKPFENFERMHCACILSSHFS